MPTPHRGVTLGAGAPQLRRQLGPTAWCALEVLAASIDADGDAHASVRTVAAELGVAVNTAQRAIGRLRRAGIVEHAQRRSVDGHFAAATYRLEIPTDVFTIATAPNDRFPTRSPSSHRTVKSTPPTEQLLLLPT
jgi:DNA-binding transcriptional MocR family regulator